MNYTHRNNDGNSGGPDDDEWMWRFYEEDYQETTADVAAHLVPMCVTVLSIVGCYVILRESFADLRAGGSNPNGLSSSSQSTPKTSRLRRTSSVVRSGRERRGHVIAKQFISLSTAYMIYHLVRVLGPIPAPARYDVWATSGNIATCELTGFFGQFGLCAAAVCTTLLVWLYTIMVCKNLTEDAMDRRFVWSNAITWIISFVVAVAAIPFGIYNFNGTVCWFASVPAGCEEEPGSCIRGGGAVGPMFSTVFHFIPYWPCLIAVIVFFIRVYRAVRRIEDRSGTYAGASTHRMDETRSTTDMTSGTNNTAVNRTKSKAVGAQAMLFIGSYVLIMVVATANIAVITVLGRKVYWLDLVNNIVFSLPGFFNLIIFARPRKEMKTPEGRLIRNLIYCCEGARLHPDGVPIQLFTRRRKKPDTGVSELSTPGFSSFMAQAQQEQQQMGIAQQGQQGQQQRRVGVDSWGNNSVEELYSKDPSAAAAAKDLYAKRIDESNNNNNKAGGGINGPTSWGGNSVEELYTIQEAVSSSNHSRSLHSTNNSNSTHKTANNNNNKKDLFSKRIDGGTSWGGASIEELYSKQSTAEGDATTSHPAHPRVLANTNNKPDPFSKRIDDDPASSNNGPTSWGGVNVSELYGESQLEPEEEESDYSDEEQRRQSAQTTATQQHNGMLLGSAGELLHDVDLRDDDILVVEEEEVATTTTTAANSSSFDSSSASSSLPGSPSAAERDRGHQQQRQESLGAIGVAAAAAAAEITDAAGARTPNDDSGETSIGYSSEAWHDETDLEGGGQPKKKKKKKKKKKSEQGTTTPDDDNTDVEGSPKKKNKKKKKKAPADAAVLAVEGLFSESEASTALDGGGAAAGGEATGDEKKKRKKKKKKKKGQQSPADDDDEDGVAEGDGAAAPRDGGKKKKKKKKKTKADDHPEAPTDAVTASDGDDDAGAIANGDDDVTRKPSI